MKTNKTLNGAAAVVAAGAIALLAYIAFTLPALRTEYNFLFVGDHQYLTFLSLPLLIAAGAMLASIRRESAMYRVTAVIFFVLAAFVMINIARLFVQMAKIAHTF